MPDPEVIAQILASEEPDTVPDTPEVPSQPMPADDDGNDDGNDDDAAAEEEEDA